MSDNFDYDPELDAQLQAEGEQMKPLIDAALQKALPPDMTPKKVEERSGLFAMYFNITRTSVAAALVYASFYARIVGLDIAKLHELLDAVDAVTKDSKLVARAQARYAEANQKFHEQQAEQQTNPLLLMPDTGIKH